MGHVADRYRRITLLRAGNRHHRRVLVIIVVAAIPEAVSVSLTGLETRAVESLQLAILIGHLGALHFDWNAFANTADDIIKQFRILVNIFRHNIVQIIGSLVFHLVQVMVPIDGTDGTKGSYLAAPYKSDSEANRDNDSQDPEENLLHDLRVLLIITLIPFALVIGMTLGILREPALEDSCFLAEHLMYRPETRESETAKNS